MNKYLIYLIQTLHKVSCGIFLILFGSIFLSSIGSIFKMEDVKVNLFGITGETLTGSITCFVISGIVLLFTIRSIRLPWKNMPTENKKNT